MLALEALTHKHYGLAFILLPDELMAAQLLIDSISRLILSKEGGLSDDESILEKDFVTHLISLARIRQQHFAYKSEDPFFKLSFDERAILYLRDKRHYPASFVATVLETREERVLASTHQARANLLEKNGQEWESSR
ncbi:MAG: hypothetical protein K9K67_13605 [Bacteriovoracaceae bacterium]|nr:hypothetical protein [Bacteriovoracaceae bacterium]